MKNNKVMCPAGFFMLLSLVVASILIAISSTTTSILLSFTYLLSAVSVIAAVYFVFAMAKVVKNQSNPGIIQGISYGGN